MLHHDENSASSPGWNPPAHLEARFGRKRRRPGTSSPCNHPLTNSNLATTRRQTLLETRKSLLRQRAAYVEKVRRARANSHEAVSERLLALQQSLSQAQDSRNAILAKIAGSCASEVAKAKQVAQEIRARREEEARVLKSGVEERMLEAERRRKEVLRDRRGKRRERGSSSSMKKIRPGAAKPTEMLKEEAAIHIQRVYRNYRNREIVRRFLELGLTIESVRDTSFEAISMKFQEEKVQKATARLLKLCGLLEHLEEVGRVEIEKACRTFLSAFLILGHPGEVLSDDGESEKALITKSKDLLIAFESFLSSPTFPPDQSLFTAWDAFNTGFTAWKTRDSEILINTMVAQYAELDLIWQKVKDDTEKHVASDFKEGIRENQLLLLVRIRRLAGERTRALIRQAVKEARRTRLPKKEKRDTRPRATPTASDGNSVSTKDEGSSVSSDAAVASITPASSTQPPETPAGGAGQSGFSPMEDSAVFSNRQIVHELALDKDFKLKTRKKGGLERMVEEQARRAFWDAMKEDVLERGELAKWIPRMAGDVKDKLLRLLEPTGSLHRMISDSIDIQIIEQQCRAGSYDYEKFFSYVLSILPKICSPARDDDVQALLNDTGDYIHRLQRLFDVLELLQLDHANFLLMVSAQYVIPEAVPYERHLFAGDLEAGRTTLTQTNQWLLKAKEEKLEEARSRDPEGVDHPSNSPSSTVIYNHAFASLIMSLGGPLTLQEIPETFHLDIERIQSYREEFRNLVLGAAMGITIKNLLRRDVRSSWKPLKDRISADLSSEIPLEPPAIAQDLCTFLQETMATPKQVISHATSAITRIATRSGSQEHQDPVVRVVSNRLLGFVLARLNAGTSKEKVRLATSGGDTLTSFGMAEWISEVGAFVERSVALADLNRNCYAVWYDGILA
ncbi:Tcp11-domain-containing protein [Choiromyces venosus 120613-1]|uniref:Tcp11-domain-containing protein n=1 Tax=Choiromyces venosus 120613-1 TaxID=1336337 RepID=A0A3N4JN97_9PEZI|nr:Tcp11-domain-containing protein [Choiromyces venosus 120613-1]